MEEKAKFVTTSRAAKMLGVACNTIAAMMDAGHLNGITLPKGHRRVSVESIEKFIANGGVKS